MDYSSMGFGELVIEGIKIASSFIALLGVLLVAREQKIIQKEQSLINISLQQDILEVSKQNSLEIKRKEFELKFFEILVNERAKSYKRFFQMIEFIQENFVVDENGEFPLSKIDEIARHIGRDNEMYAHLSNNIAAALYEWVVLITDDMEKCKSEDIDFRHLAKERHDQLTDLILNARLEMTTLHDFDSMKRDYANKVFDYRSQMKERGFEPLSALRPQEQLEKTHKRTEQDIQKQQMKPKDIYSPL